MPENDCTWHAEWSPRDGWTVVCLRRGTFAGRVRPTFVYGMTERAQKYHAMTLADALNRVYVRP